MAEVYVVRTRIYGCIVIEGVSNNLSLILYSDVAQSVLLAYFFCALLVGDKNQEDEMMREMRNLMPVLIVATAVLILRILVAIFTEIGNRTENLRLLWLGLIGQKITIVIGIVLAVVTLLVSDNWLHLFVPLLLFSYSPMFLIVLVGKRVKEINNKVDATLTQHDQN